MSTLRAGALLSGLLLSTGCGPPAPFQPDADAIALNNRGVALMGRYEYAAARETFAQLAGEHPRWLDLRVNLAVATLNRQEEGDERRALAELEAVLAKDPRNPRARYLRGLIHYYLGDAAAAIAELGAVAQEDSTDAYAAYFYAQSLLQNGRVEDAIVWFRRAIDRDPYLRSGYYGAALALRRAGRAEEASAMQEGYERFADNPRAELAEMRYTRMGPKALALALPAKAPAAAIAAAVPAGDLFLPARRVADVMFDPGASLTTADVDADGDQDLFLASPGGTTVWSAGPDGAYTPVTGHSLSGITSVAAALWGDVDNDGLLDVYLCRRGPSQLWRQRAPGDWEEIGARSGVTNGNAQCRDGVLFDADHDGDLDIFVVNAGAPNELYNNDLDGTFRPIAHERGLGGTGAGRGIVTADFDGDRDADILVLREEPPHELLVNDRLWLYREGTGYDALRASAALGAVSGDVDADGRAEIYLLGEGGDVARWRRRGDGVWSPDVVFRLPAPTAAGQLALQDFSGDGRPDLLLVSDDGIRVLSFSDTGEVRVAFEARGGGESGAIALLADPARGPAVAGLTSGPRPGIDLWPAGPGRYDFLALVFTGDDERANSMRSNASGIGTRFALRNGSRWTVADTFDAHSGPGQSAQPVAVGLAGSARADYVAIDWSDGVFQTELELDAGKVHRIAETQRQLASCPVLFAWDGTRNVFVTDLLGVGGIGFFVEPGVYAEPRPWERFLLPDGLLATREGRFALKLTQPMEEVAYLDHARLIAYDLPPGWSLLLDERFAIGGPVPTGEAFYYAHAVLPVHAVNDRGDDVLDAIAEADGRAAPPGALDRRFVGRLAGEHTLELAFAEPLDARRGRPVLAVEGWIEYPYSQTLFAAWQAGARYEAPTLEAAAADGPWHTVVESFGYPAGMPRGMALPLDGLPPGTTRLRLYTNMQVYWDRIRVVWSEALSDARVQSLDPVEARLARVGFPRRTIGAQHRPGFDYETRAPSWDTRYMAGDYTAFGDVLPLVAAEDDALLIIGSGEEAHLEFVPPADAPPPGWSRRYVLDVRGYAKDMDLYTRDGETVGPLPARLSDPASAERRDALHAQYHVRRMAGRQVDGPHRRDPLHEHR